MKQLTFSQIEAFVMADIKAGLTPALMGEAGIGKSSFLKEVAKKLGTKVFVISINQLADRSDLTGARMIEENGVYKQAFFPHAYLMDGISYALANPKETPIIFLDEFNRTTADVTSACFTFITERKVGTTEFPDNVRFVVAGNDTGNVSSLDEASVTRLSMYRVKADTQTFLSKVPNLNSYVKKVLVSNPDLLFVGKEESDDDDDYIGQFEESELEQLVRPRTVEFLSNWLTELGLNGPVDRKQASVMSQLVNPLQSSDSLLEEGIYAHTGENDFSRAVYGEINNAYLDSLNNPIAITTNAFEDIIDEPQLNYLGNMTTKDELFEALDNMVEEERNTLYLSLLSNEGVTILNNADVTKLIIEYMNRIAKLDKASWIKFSEILNEDNVAQQLSAITIDLVKQSQNGNVHDSVISLLSTFNII